MDSRLAYKTPLTKLNPTTRKTPPEPSRNFRHRRAVVVVASAGAARNYREFCCSLNTPLEPRSVAGKYLRSVLLNQPQLFDVAVAQELQRLADERNGAVSRMNKSSGSEEECLHRRIAQIKEHECRISVEDVMYVLIISKFSDIKVPLVPRLSRCICNSRLEIWPSKDWELQSIHGFDFLEMIKEHISSVIGLRADSSISEHWATTNIRLPHLGRVYAASILYGYFLKSASLRLHLERSLTSAHQERYLSPKTSFHFPESWQNGLKSLLSGRFSNVQSTLWGQSASAEEGTREKLRCYVMGFDPETMQRCAKVKSKESVNLIEKHTCALLGDDNSGFLDSDEVMIMTSFSSLKRLVLEAVAFGMFLWDTEEYVDNIYRLRENI